MLRHLARYLLALCLAFGGGSLGNSALAQANAPDRPRSDGGKAQGETAGPGVLRLLPADAVSERQITIAGKPLAYTATAGTLPLYETSGEQSAAIFYTAYVAKDAGSNRPLTFVFNGGPGAASAYLHMGFVGPRILPLGPQGREPSRAQLADNPHTWLAFTDLVMIDPVGTGWSRAAKPDGDKPFRTVQGDAGSIAKAIALYVTRNGRHAAPLYLLGESYGGFRAAKVARALQREQSLFASGIVMVSPLLDGAYVFGSSSSALASALQFPSVVASELERRGTFSLQTMAEAERFALTDYLITLAGPPLTGDAARAFHDRIAAMTGLSPDVVADARGHITEAAARIRKDGMPLITSIYDGGVAVENPFPESGRRRVDPLLDGATRAYGSAFAAYARDELGFRTDMTYALLAPSRWDWGDAGRLGASAMGDLRELLTLDRSFRLLVMHGYSDLVTTYGVSRYLLDQLPFGRPDRAALKVYRGGHMMYLNEDTLREATEDARAFYRAGAARDPR